MRFKRQLVAAGGDGLGLIEPFCGRATCDRLPPVATTVLHKGSTLRCQTRRQRLRRRRSSPHPRRVTGRSPNQRYGYLIPCASRTPVIFANRKNGRVALQRMDNVGIVVESLDAAISFFAELGLELEGRAMIEGDWSGRVTGLRDQRVEIAMMRTPDGHGRIDL